MFNSTTTWYKSDLRSSDEVKRDRAKILQERGIVPLDEKPTSDGFDDSDHPPPQAPKGYDND